MSNNIDLEKVILRTGKRDIERASNWLRVINADRSKISPIVLKYWEEEELCNFMLDSKSADRIYIVSMLYVLNLLKYFAYFPDYFTWKSFLSIEYSQGK